MIEAMGLKPSTAQNVDSGRGSNLRGKELTKQLSTPKRSLGQIVMDSRRKFPIDNSMYGADLQGFGLPKNVPGGMPNTYYMENWGGDGITYDNDASYAITDDMGWKGHQNMTHANAPQGVKDLYNQRFRERYGDQGLASFNDPWAGPEFQQAKGTTWQEFLQDTSPAAAFDPAIHNSWQDVYQSWLNQNTFS